MTTAKKNKHSWDPHSASHPKQPCMEPIWETFRENRAFLACTPQNLTSEYPKCCVYIMSSGKSLHYNHKHTQTHTHTHTKPTHGMNNLLEHTAQSLESTPLDLINGKMILGKQDTK